MPKDLWAKLRRRDAASRQRLRPCSAPKPASYSTALNDPKWVAHSLSQFTKLWFGKYNGTPIKDIPLTYLKWLITTQQPDALRGRIGGLILFLTTSFDTLKTDKSDEPQSTGVRSTYRQGERGPYGAPTGTATMIDR